MVTGFKYLLIATFIITLSGCKFGPVKDRDGVTDTEQEQQQQVLTDAEKAAEDQRYAADMAGGFDGKALDDPNSPLSKRVFYFGIDSSQISTEDREVIAAHAGYLAQNPGVTIVLEGHADERGTREYNIALGERRAKSVLQLLLIQGVSSNQVQVISFGEERPVALDHDDASWRLNRRVELLYSGY